MLSTLKTENTPFSEQQLKQLQSSIGGLNSEQSQWLIGYLSGCLAGSMPSTGTAQHQADPALSLAIITATETGNSEAIANRLVSRMEQLGISVQLHSMDSFRPAALRKLKYVAFIISTHGEGDPPDEAMELFEYLESERAPVLADLNYSVLALGDRSYSLFCEAGRKLERLLRARDAQAFAERIECDVDFNSDADAFGDNVIRYARDKLVVKPNSAFASHLSLVPIKSHGESHGESHWSKEQPFSAEISLSQKITGTESDKDVRHLELSLEDSGLQYLPGDALGVWAPNDPQLVSHLLTTLQIDAPELARFKEQELSIDTLLTNHLEITRLTADTVLGYARVGGRTELAEHYSALDVDQQQRFIQSRQLVDLVDAYPARLKARDLVEILRPLTPRSYSIASSQNVVDEEVHLTVATLDSNAIGKTRQGVASGFLNHRLKQGGKVKVFLEPNRRFHLPDEQDAPLIMIAAGTGIAPYRAFMQELQTRTTQPDSWLIFGNPNLRSGFLYQREWLRWRDSGLLKRIDTAWSRDQAEKHYVQDVVVEQASRIDAWLQRGAYIYICGSMAMGQAVLSSLHSALAKERGIDTHKATEVMAGLRRERRIRKDLY